MFSASMPVMPPEIRTVSPSTDPESPESSPPPSAQPARVSVAIATTPSAIDVRRCAGERIPVIFCLLVEVLCAVRASKSHPCELVGNRFHSHRRGQSERDTIMGCHNSVTLGRKDCSAPAVWALWF